MEHKGVISEICQNAVRIRLIDHSSCSSCHVKGSCGLSESKDKIIDIETNTSDYYMGQLVTILFQESQGIKALLLGYLFPFLLVFMTLIVCSFFIANEIIVGLSSLLVLLPYYFFLAFNKNKLKKIFSFKIVQNTKT